jgi:Protein of unknown function (DUF3703)
MLEKTLIARRRAFEILLSQQQALARTEANAQWRWLEAAHVLGQPVFTLHARSHLRMLGLALRERDGVEVAGQLFRLALVPLGHLLHRLPAGNTGRSRVNAFMPMTTPPNVVHLIQKALDQAHET